MLHFMAGLRRRVVRAGPELVPCIAVLIAVGSAQTADLLTFLRMVDQVGPRAEANPIIALAAGAGHILPLVAVKIALVVLVTSAFALVVRHRKAFGSAVATLAVLAGLLGAFSNLTALRG